MGRTKYIKTPEKMWELFEAYRKETKASPIHKMDFKGKDADTVYYELEQPLTMEGFQNYVADQPDMPWTLDHYFSNREERYSDFVGICSRIRRVIRADQIKGGMVGIYNPSITQRLNNLVERTENKNTQVTHLFKSDLVKDV